MCKQEALAKGMSVHIVWLQVYNSTPTKSTPTQYLASFINAQRMHTRVTLLTFVCVLSAGDIKRLYSILNMAMCFLLRLLDFSTHD